MLAPDGKPEGFITCGGAPTNCAFSGETLWVTDAGVLAASTEPSYAGKLWRLHRPGRRRADLQGQHRGRKT